MGLFDTLKELITRTDSRSEPDSSWPQDDVPEYYSDVSIQSYVVPALPPDQWAPTIDQNIPFRGVEEHGVPFNSAAMNITPTPQAEAEVREKNHPLPEPSIISEHLVDPIPVVVVETPEPITRSIKLVTTTFLIDTTVVGTQPVLIAPRKLSRQKLWVRVSGQSINIGPDQTTVVQLGFPISPTLPSDTLDTTEPLYAIPTTNGATTIFVMEEYVVDAEGRVT